MKKILTHENLKKIIKKASNNLSIEEIKITSNNFNKLKEYLNNQVFLDSERISLLFQFNQNTNYPIGFIIKNLENKIVGFMGTLFYEKFINKKKFIFCNIHSWIVNKRFRLNSFFLITPLLKEKLNLTAYTPVKSLEGLLEKFGFNKTMLNYKIVININLIRFVKKDFSIITEENIVLNYLNNDEIVEFKKHSNKIFNKFIILNKNNNKYVFIIARKIKKKFINLFNFFYISNKNEFSNNWSNIKNLISNEFNINIFSEYYFNNKESFFPSNILYYKIIKKIIYSKTTIELDKFDIQNSDLLIS
jgi:hypothetical protein